MQNQCPCHAEMQSTIIYNVLLKFDVTKLMALTQRLKKPMFSLSASLSSATFLRFACLRSLLQDLALAQHKYKSESRESEKPLFLAGPRGCAEVAL